MNYEKIDITEEHKGWICHVTPIKNLANIRKWGLIRPDLLRNRGDIEHVSPYDAFRTTKSNHSSSKMKDSYTYFGIWNTETFKSWAYDETVVDHSIILKLNDSSVLVETHDLLRRGRYRSSWKSINFNKFTLISFISDKNKLESQQTEYCLLKTTDSFELYKLIYEVKITNEWFF